MPMAPEPTTSSDFGIFSRDHGLLVAPDQLAVGLQAGQLAGAGAGGQDDVLGLERLLAALGELDRELALAGELRLAVEDGDLVLLEQEADAAAELLRHAAAALDHGGGVEAGVVGGEAEARRRGASARSTSAERSSALVGMQPQFRQMPPRCSRSTSATFMLELRRADGRHVAAGTAADDDQVEALGH